ncbi:MAG: hypothetical protein NT169_17960 [Chloroflexi bacterium]|nr:hypothetical protein [Chloroflexota bacterium]
MGFLDNLKKALGGGQGAKGSGGGSSRFGGGDPNAYWIYAQCRRCGEPLKARVNLMNDPSEADEGEGWVVRKGLSGTGVNRCFQTVEVTLTLDAKKRSVIASEAVGGKLITEEEYEALLRAA